MKKKVLAGILAATMAFSMAACGSTGSSSDSGSSAASGSTAKTEEKGEPYTVTMVLQGSHRRKNQRDSGAGAECKARYRCSSVGKRISAVTADAFRR